MIHDLSGKYHSFDEGLRRAYEFSIIDSQKIFIDYGFFDIEQCRFYLENNGINWMFFNDLPIARYLKDGDVYISVIKFNYDESIELKLRIVRKIALNGAISITLDKSGKISYPAGWTSVSENQLKLLLDYINETGKTTFSKLLRKRDMK